MLKPGAVDIGLDLSIFSLFKARFNPHMKLDLTQVQLLGAISNPENRMLD